MNNFNLSKIILPIALITSHTNWALADGRLAGEFYEKALVAHRNSEDATAIIELKNAIQHNPNYVTAYLLLGEIYLQQKSLSEAEVNLSLAKQLGVDKSLIAKPLAQLYLYEIKYKQLIDEIDPADFSSDLQADLHIFRGHAYLQLNQTNEALNEYAKTAEIDATRADAIIGKANALLRRGEIKEATDAAELAAKLEPNNPGVWYVKGSIKHVQTDLEGAIKDYDKSIELMPDYQDARIARAGVLMDMHQDQRAKQDLEYLRKNYPFDPKAAYLNAVLLERNGEKEASQKELVAAADIIAAVKPQYLIQHGPTLMLSGLVNYSLQRTELAAEYLRLYIKNFPEQPGPYKLLASILLAKNEPEQVIDLLKNQQIKYPKDHRMMFLLGNAYMQAGKHDQANRLLEQATNLQNEDDSMHTELGLSRLSMGQEGLAIPQLEAAIKINPGDSQAGVPLTAIYIQNGESEKALRVAEGMYQQNPKNLTLLNLLGMAQVSAQQLKEARHSFEQAIAIDSEFITAAINLSKLDLSENKIDSAKNRLQKLLKKQPENMAVLLELAATEQAAGDLDAANRWLEQARKIDSDDLSVLLMQAELNLKMNRAPEALNIAQTAELIDKGNMQTLDVLARSYLATDSREKALGVYRRMAEQARLDVRKLYKVANYQIQAGDQHDAINTLKKAVQADETHIPSQMALTELELNYGKPVLAVSRAQNLLKDHPKRGFPHQLLGDIAAHDNDFAQAVNHYQAGFDLEPNTLLLMKLYQSLKQTRQNDQAVTMLTEWLKKNPLDYIPMAALAEEYLQSGQLSEAQKYYETLLKQFPDEPKFLNNLANIFLHTGNDKALMLAEKAQQLAPDKASSNDTLGWILVKQGKAEQGLSYLRNAHARQSQDPEIRYHIAVALTQLQRNEEAKQELEQALKPNLPFNGMDQAKELLKKLTP